MWASHDRLTDIGMQLHFRIILKVYGHGFAAAVQEFSRLCWCPPGAGQWLAATAAVKHLNSSQLYTGTRRW